MGSIKGFVSLGRPTTTLSGALSTVMGGFVAETGQWGVIALAALITALVTSAANAWNDYLDVDIDRVNRPDRPLPSGRVSLGAAWRFSLVLSGISLLLAWLINPPTFVLALLSIILLYVYSWRLKSTVLLGNVTVAAISAASVVFGGLAAGNAQPTLWLAVIIFVAIAGREVLKSMADYEGDLRLQCRTVATVWGKRVSRNIFYILATMTGVVMIMPYMLRLYDPVYAYVIGFGVYPVLVYVLWRVARDMSPKGLNTLSRLMKYDFLVFFLAVVLGSG